MRSSIRNSEIIIYYDADCRLCKGFISFVRRHSKFSEQQFKTLQADLPLCSLDSVIVEHDNIRHQKSEAILIVFRQLNLPWRLFVVIAILPKFVRDKFYDLVARNRFKWFGKIEKDTRF